MLVLRDIRYFWRINTATRKGEIHTTTHKGEIQLLLQEGDWCQDGPEVGNVGSYLHIMFQRALKRPLTPVYFRQ